MSLNRRQFMAGLTGLSGAALLPVPSAGAVLPPAAQPYIACNSYAWHTFYGRAGKQWMKDPDASLAEFKQAGLTGYEPGVADAEEVRKLVPYLKKYGLAMQSLYVNSTLHKADEAEKSIASVLAIADAAKPAGTRLFVTNPSPISWNGTDNKNDAELTEQARNLDRLGAELRGRGITLAYHTHAPELREAGREFHHMLLATDPRNVTLCLDAHWIYRGAGNSQVALFDIVKLYGKRISELHIRQSQHGIWSETFGEGDIDYRRLTRELKAMNVKPLLVLEQCLEKGSPNTMSAVEAHRQDLAYAREVFAGLLS